MIRLAIPKGRLFQGVQQLLNHAGIFLSETPRHYRPRINLDHFTAKILKPQSIVHMLHIGSHDLGFAASDWVQELQADVVELLDTYLDPFRIVAAAPAHFLHNGQLPNQHVVVASEYEQLTKNWISKRCLNATFIRSYGATEAFPPEDADCIVDNTSTGETLKAHQLSVFEEILFSSTRLYASRVALEDHNKRLAIENFAARMEKYILPHPTDPA